MLALWPASRSRRSRCRTGRASPRHDARVTVDELFDAWERGSGRDRRVRAAVRRRPYVRGPADAGAAARRGGAGCARPDAVGGVPGRARERDRRAAQRRPRLRAVQGARHASGSDRQGHADRPLHRSARGRLRGSRRTAYCCGAPSSMPGASRPASGCCRGPGRGRTRAPAAARLRVVGPRRFDVLCVLEWDSARPESRLLVRAAAPRAAAPMRRANSAAVGGWRSARRSTRGWPSAFAGARVSVAVLRAASARAAYEGGPAHAGR